MIVVAGEELVRSGAADDNPLPLLGNALHQQPLHLTADAGDRGVMLPDQFNDFFPKPLGGYGNRGVLDR
jgi:hypothetical protein